MGEGLVGFLRNASALGRCSITHRVGRAVRYLSHYLAASRKVAQRHNPWPPAPSPHTLQAPHHLHNTRSALCMSSVALNSIGLQPRTSPFCATACSQTRIR